MSENPVHHFKSVCTNCNQEVEFLSIFDGDKLCASCQYAPPKEKVKKKPDQFGWTLHPDCRQILDKQSAEWTAGAQNKLSLKMIRQQKRARAMKGG